jgi:hypothetical protein
MWRSNYIIAKKQCIINEEKFELSECGFECNLQTKSEMIQFLFPQIRFWADTNKEGATEAWIDFMCNGDAGKVFTGDHLESASTADPSFWVMHPTLERLLHAKLMTGGFENEQWAADHVHDYICNRPKCYNETTHLKDYYDECCYGHNEEDRLLDAISANRYVKVGPTNAEMIRGTDPRTSYYTMPYIYDQFVWDHCDEDFDSLLQSMHQQMTLLSKKTGRQSFIPLSYETMKIDLQKSMMPKDTFKYTSTLKSTTVKEQKMIPKLSSTKPQQMNYIVKKY